MVFWVNFFDGMVGAAETAFPAVFTQHGIHGRLFVFPLG